MNLEILNTFEGEISSLLFTAFVFIIGLTMKDLLTSASFGFLFYIDKNFNEGDNVYVDGQLSTIVNISIKRTIFKIHETNRWKYVPNSRIRYLNLEKVIEPNSQDK